MDFIRSPQSAWQKGLGGEAAAKRWPQALAADTYLAAARRRAEKKATVERDQRTSVAA
jgi:hypothetical protein